VNVTRRRFVSAGALAAVAARRALAAKSDLSDPSDKSDGTSPETPPMTLILGARAEKHAVVLADGVSTIRTADGSTKVLREDLRKIFPSDAHPYVLVHHGLNVLGALPVGPALEGVIKTELDPAWVRGLNIATARAIEALDSPVAQNLKAGREKAVFGLWLAGRWPCTPCSEIVEVLWDYDGAARARVGAVAHGDLVIGGTGAAHIKEYLKKPLDERFDGARIWRESPDYAVDFLTALYRRALERQGTAGTKQFGGQARIAVITESGVKLRDL
jgi:hypothetical protein